MKLVGTVMKSEPPESVAWRRGVSRDGLNGSTTGNNGEDPTMGEMKVA